MAVQSTLFSVLLTLFSLLLNAPKAIASTCSSEYTLTEILLDTQYPLAIFTATVDSNFMINGERRFSFVTTNEIFRGGQIAKHLIVEMSGEVGEQYLLFRRFSKNSNRPNDFYKTGWCNDFGIHLSSKYPEQRKKGKARIQLIRKFLKLKKEQFSGYQKFWEGDKIYAKGYFKNGESDGQWTHFDYLWEGDDQQIINSKLTYKVGVLDGECKRYSHYPNSNHQLEYYENGNLKRRETFAIKDSIRYLSSIRIVNDDYFQITEFSSNGDIQSQMNWQTYHLPNIFHQPDMSIYHGKMQNMQVYGKIRGIGTGEYYRGAKIGKWTYLAAKTGEKSTETYQPDLISSYNFVVFLENGKKYVEGNLIAGKPEGKWLYYNVNSGKLYKAVNFSNGELGGVAIEFYSKTGNQRVVKFYENGALEGESLTYFADGTTVAEEAFYKNGGKVGIWKRYFKNGNLLESQSYKNDKKHGWNYVFSETGDTLVAEQYFKDYREGNAMKINDSFNNNPLKFVGQHHLGYLTGLWKIYFLNGELAYSCDLSKHAPGLMHWINLIFTEDMDCYDKDGKKITSEEVSEISGSKGVGKKE